MFGKSQDDDDDLPFRVLEDEAAKSSSGFSSNTGAVIDDPFIADAAANIALHDDAKMDELS
jgi:hypothetical protein